MPVIINGEVVSDSSPRAVQYRKKQAQASAREEKQGLLSDDADIEELANDERRVYFGCLALCAVFLVLFYLWLLLMEFTVGIHAMVNNVPCDKPLATFLIGCASATVFMMVLQAWLANWAARNEGIDDPESIVGPTELVMLIWCSMMTMLFWVVWIILGNYWVFSSKTCDATSKNFVPSPKVLMFSVYQGALYVTYFTDFMILFSCLEACMRRAMGGHRHGASGPNTGRMVFANPVFTPGGLMHWVSLSRRADSGGARSDYANV